MSAARALAAAGVDVLVLEARSRVGGRTLNHPLAGDKVIVAGRAAPGSDRFLRPLEVLAVL